MAYLLTKLPLCIIATWMFLNCGIITICLALSTRQTFYKPQPAAENVCNNTVVISSSATTSTECGIFCSEDKSCISFTFDAQTSTCHTSNGTVSIGNDKTYILSTDCPAERGYTLYKRQDILMCIKFRDTNVTRAVADDDCRNEGGHLLLITSEAMHTFVKDIVRQCVNKTMWIDGEDLYANNTMYSWTGEQVPYILWARNEPGNDTQDCLSLGSLVKEFDFRDVYCIKEIGYICQQELHQM